MNNTVFWLGQDERGAGIVSGRRAISRSGFQRTQLKKRFAGTVTFQQLARLHIRKMVIFSMFRIARTLRLRGFLIHQPVCGMSASNKREGVFERHRAQCHAYAYSTHVVGDYANGKVYSMSSSVYSDAGDEISRTRIAPHATSGLKLVRHNSFQLDMEVGVGLDGSGQGIDPQVMMKFSDDGGHVWSNEEVG
ncbi:MAG: hypothetical protein IPJ84_19165 [Bdellovibrionales bacterium]|nr:hypothetical protein [Bdellovibrionales bacterium]